MTHKLLPLLVDCLGNCPTEKYTVEELDSLLQLKTGGISLSTRKTSSIYDRDVTHRQLCFQVNAFTRNTEPAMDLLMQVLVYKVQASSVYSQPYVFLLDYQ